MEEVGSRMGDVWFDGIKFKVNRARFGRDE